MKKLLFVMAVLGLAVCLCAGAMAAKAEKGEKMDMRIGIGGETLSVTALGTTTALNLANVRFDLKKIQIDALLGFYSVSSPSESAFCMGVQGALVLAEIEAVQTKALGRILFGSSTKRNVVLNTDVKGSFFEFLIGLGCEYFPVKQVGLEGAVGLGFFTVTPDKGDSQTVMGLGTQGTFAGNLGIHYYFEM